MTATKSSFPAITSPEAAQEDDNEKDPILVFVSTSCENGKKAPVFIRKFNLFPTDVLLSVTILDLHIAVESSISALSAMLP